jgi:hypothetical protein
MNIVQKSSIVHFWFVDLSSPDFCIMNEYVDRITPKLYSNINGSVGLSLALWTRKFNLSPSRKLLEVCGMDSTISIEHVRSLDAYQMAPIILYCWVLSQFDFTC